MTDANLLIGDQNLGNPGQLVGSGVGQQFQTPAWGQLADSFGKVGEYLIGLPQKYLSLFTTDWKYLAAFLVLLAIAYFIITNTTPLDGPWAFVVSLLIVILISPFWVAALGGF